jgi:hypothetical protein
MDLIKREVAERMIQECRRRVDDRAVDLLVLEQLVVDLADDRDGWREQASYR